MKKAKKQPSIKLDLTVTERSQLRKNKIKKSDLSEFSIDELSEIMGTGFKRARELRALADFQRIPTIGIRFAEDLVFMGLYSIEELQYHNGAKLREEYEFKKGYRIDSCVEDQFRLVVHFAKTQDYSKTWWDFTEERKEYRSKVGYPADRPILAWHEVLKKPPAK